MWCGVVWCGCKGTQRKDARVGDTQTHHARVLSCCDNTHVRACALAPSVTTPQTTCIPTPTPTPRDNTATRAHPHPRPHRARSPSRRRPHRGVEGTQDKVVWCDGMWCGVVWCGGEGRTCFKLCLLLPRHRHRHPTHAPNPRPPTTIRSPRYGRRREGDLGVVVTTNEASATITTTITTTTTDQARPVAAARSVAVKSAKGADLTYVTQVDACP